MTVESTAARKPRRSAGTRKSPSTKPELVQLLTPEGKRVKNAEYDKYVADITPEALRGLYRDMVLTRRFDAEATSLQRQGELGSKVLADVAAILEQPKKLITWA